MGYTHYYEQKQPPTAEQWSAISGGFKKLMAAAFLTTAFPIQRDHDDTSPPEITATHIIFNGIGDSGHETMSLGEEAWFCKTNGKPYDVAVVALLILANHYAPDSWDITSDGVISDWQPTLDWMNSTGLAEFTLPKGITNYDD